MSVEDVSYKLADDVVAGRGAALTREQIEEAASSFACDFERVELTLREELKLEPQPREPQLTDVVERIGGRISYRDFFEIGASGTIQVHAPGRFDIVLPSETSFARDRFTIGHELGHYVLHANHGETKLIARRSGVTLAEIEANLFAAAFLMPKDLFLEKLRFYGDVAMAADWFDLPRDAALIRCAMLGV
jgi:Zn-dependent peptidase ImmA (M78 family)